MISYSCKYTNALNQAKLHFSLVVCVSVLGTINSAFLLKRRNPSHVHLLAHLWARAAVTGSFFFCLDWTVIYSYFSQEKDAISHEQQKPSFQSNGKASTKYRDIGELQRTRPEGIVQVPK